MVKEVTILYKVTQKCVLINLAEFSEILSALAI